MEAVGIRPQEERIRITDAMVDAKKAHPIGVMPDEDTRREWRRHG